ncbi:hypothetical protein GGS20DRAFT_548854 [Poronia punctata]|nr:hypothetical protein GGS20DRAFT_548854 [Poronia punctata]
MSSPTLSNSLTSEESYTTRILANVRQNQKRFEHVVNKSGTRQSNKSSAWDFLTSNSPFPFSPDASPITTTITTNQEEREEETTTMNQRMDRDSQPVRNTKTNTKTNTYEYTYDDDDFLSRRPLLLGGGRGEGCSRPCSYTYGSHPLRSNPIPCCEYSSSIVFFPQMMDEDEDERGCFGGRLRRLVKRVFGRREGYGSLV